MTRSDFSAPRLLALGREADAVPAIVGRLALVVVVAGVAGRWAPAVVVGWVGVGLGLLTRLGERMAVTALGWRRLRGRCVVRTGVARVLTVGGVSRRPVDCYVIAVPQPNAFATGARSVAVTAGLLDAVAAGRVDDRVFEAVLAHEIGHLVSGATRFRLATWWWTAPWRHTGRRFVALCVRPRRLQGRVPTVARITLALIGVSAAAGQLVRAGQLSAAALLVAGTVSALVGPRIGAAVNRRCETVADDYAVHQGRSDDLARAIFLLTPNAAPTLGRRRFDHPDPGRRLRRLDRAEGPRAGAASEPLGTPRAPRPEYGRDRTLRARSSAPTP